MSTPTILDQHGQPPDEVTRRGLAIYSLKNTLGLAPGSGGRANGQVPSGLEDKPWKRLSIHGSSKLAAARPEAVAEPLTNQKPPRCGLRDRQIPRSLLRRRFHEERLRADLEPAHTGEVVAIHLDSGDYTVAASSPEAMRAMRRIHPSGLLFLYAIGPSPDYGLARHMRSF